jgi:hypothetical protein
MAAFKTLSDAQKLILNNAAARPDDLIFPLPADFRARGAVRQKVLQAMLKTGFVVERLTTEDTLIWRRDARRRRFTLVMTAAGRIAIGLAAGNIEAPAVASIVQAKRTGGPASSTTEPGGKLGSVLSALTAEDGATLAALAALTGWLPHTTRAALCRLRQRGYPVRLIGAPGSKAYRLDTPAQG